MTNLLSDCYSILNEMETVRQSARPRLRPGEHREPLLVALAPAQHSLFVSECRVGQMAPERAYALLLERRLLLDDLGDLEGSVFEIAALLDSAARDVRAELALDGMSSIYLRSFAKPARNAPVASTLLVPVPLRLYARAATLAPEATIAPGAVAQAVAWERASVARGRTMAEWGLVTALSAYARGSTGAGLGGAGRR